MSIFHSGTIVLTAALLLASIASPMPSQQAEVSAGDIVRGLRSPDETVRNRVAAREVAFLRRGGDAGVFSEPASRDALLMALTEANTITRQAALGHDPRVTAEVGEGRAEYVAMLLELSQHAFPLIPSDAEKRTWLRELARSPYGDESAFARWIADQGNLVVDALLDQRLHAELGVERTQAYSVLAQMVAASAAGARVPPLRQAFSVDRRQQALNAVDEGLDLKDDVTTPEIVRTLRRNPSSDSLRVLQGFAKRASGNGDFTRKRERARSLQDDVEDAIRDVEQRLLR